MLTRRGSSASEESLWKNARCEECLKLSMRLACIEPDKPGHDLRTYVCLICSSSTAVVVKFDQTGTLTS